MAFKNPIVICLEGIDGTFKTSIIEKLRIILSSDGYKVLVTKEPGTPLIPLTMELRNFMLDKKYDSVMTPIAREFISQAIRSIHYEKVIKPLLEENREYDFILQDRGVLSGIAYGIASGHPPEFIESLANTVLLGRKLENIYTKIIYLDGDVKTCLSRAKNAKNEFKEGDVIEDKGIIFMEKVKGVFDGILKEYNNLEYIEVTDFDSTFKEVYELIKDVELNQRILRAKESVKELQKLADESQQLEMDIKSLSNSLQK